VVNTIFRETCVCGRVFNFPGAMKNHRRSCTRTKKRLASTLETAKGLWTIKKRQRIENIQSQQTQTQSRESKTQMPMDLDGSVDAEVCDV